ncbi:MAG TPA: hypothetical protein VFW99_03065 [Candidatus Nitrosotalea sp.]|nr:hypothetical protein [Candidatus Nitrosotalea sp.]
MNLEWIVTGIVLFGAMIACGISLYIKRRKEQNLSLDSSNDLRM